MRRMLAVIVGGVVLAFGLVGAAQAKNSNSPWNSSSNPLVTSGYGSEARAYGHVKVADSASGTRLFMYSYNRFVDADNHRAYLMLTPQFNAGTCRAETSTVAYKGVQVASSSSCAGVFYSQNDIRSDGLNYTTSTWTAMPTKSVAVNAKADRGRVRARLCIDIPARPDPCGGTAVSESDSY